MNARMYADGSVEGSYNRMTHLEDGGVEKGQGTVVCFTIIGNTAWIGGMVPGNSPPDVAWQVVDNGQGADAPADKVGLQIEAVDFGFEAGFASEFCEETPESLDFGPFGVIPLAALLKDIEAGNIQIRSGE